MLSARSLSTKTVITSDGRIVGRLGTAMVGRDWDIPLFLLLLDREVARRFHIRKPLLGAPKAFVSPEEVAALSDNVILSRPLDEMNGHLHAKGGGREAARMVGRKVLGEGGYYFGDLTDLTVDQGHWRVQELLVEVRKRAAEEMGFPLTLFGTCQAKVPVRRVEQAKDHVLAEMGPEGFKEYVIKEQARD